MPEFRAVSVVGEIVVDGTTIALARSSSVEDKGMINAALSLNPGLCIVLNDAACALPDHLILVLIGHELGHYFEGHRDHYYYGRHVADEIAADKYSVRYAGLAATRQLLNTMRKCCIKRGLPTVEADARLAALPKCPKVEQKSIPNRKKRRKKK